MFQKVGGKNCLVRGFSVDARAFKKLKSQIFHNYKVLNLFGKYRDFGYERQELEFDRVTGKITVKEKGDAQEELNKKVIRNLDDLEREKREIMREIGIDESADVYGIEYKTASVMANERIDKEMRVDIDADQMYQYSLDFMRVDLGLLIQRPPIFMKMRDRDMKFLKLRTEVMNEYWCD